MGDMLLPEFIPSPTPGCLGAVMSKVVLAYVPGTYAFMDWWPLILGNMQMVSNGLWALPYPLWPLLMN